MNSSCILFSVPWIVPPFILFFSPRTTIPPWLHEILLIILPDIYLQASERLLCLEFSTLVTFPREYLDVLWGHPRNRPRWLPFLKIPTWLLSFLINLATLSKLSHWPLKFGEPLTADSLCMECEPGNLVVDKVRMQIGIKTLDFPMRAWSLGPWSSSLAASPSSHPHWAIYVKMS